MVGVKVGMPAVGVKVSVAVAAGVSVSGGGRVCVGIMGVDGVPQAVARIIKAGSRKSDAFEGFMGQL